MTTTNAHEVHFTNLAAFLEDAKLDHDAGVIADSILRLAVTNGPASMGQITGRQLVGEWSEVPGWRTRFLECWYISTRGYLVKLSAYAGVDHIGGKQWDGLRTREPDFREQKSAATKEKVADLGRRLQTAVYSWGGIEFRGGGLYLENGFWTASPEDEIADLPELSCASCLRPIYFANDAYRHREAATGEGLDRAQLRWKKGEAACYLECPCPTCGGTRVNPKQPDQRCSDCTFSPGLRLTIHHYADPEIEGKLV